MLKFREITKEDRSLIESYTHKVQSRQLNYTFEVLYLWRDACEFMICEHKGMLLIKTFYYCNHNFLFPLGSGDLREALDLMMEYSVRHKCPFSMLKLNEGQVEMIKEVSGEELLFEENRDEEEYIYLSEKLITLQGKKLQPKRNHINALEKASAWHLSPITPENIDEVKQFNQAWAGESQWSNVTPSMKIENEALTETLNRYFDIPLDGAVLYIDNKMAGFSIGCPTHYDTYMTLFERADSSIRGAYPLLNREFTKAYASGFTYVNRAEDCGDEGLRRAKLSYYPEKLDKRFTAKINR